MTVHSFSEIHAIYADTAKEINKTGSIFFCKKMHGIKIANPVCGIIWNEGLSLPNLGTCSFQGDWRDNSHVLSICRAAIFAFGKLASTLAPPHSPYLHKHSRRETVFHIHVSRSKAHFLTR